ncbi:hypothetical protein ACIRD3_32105 [Kitasatospora sp. NPDC093550]|uniref:hypothetical protein n=1 Tax=Kitasatospora sp. NPDC093550 TaxID=3364089 RepID=UPI0038078518
MADPASHELTPEQLREVFDAEIVDFVFGGRTPGDRPVAILTGACRLYDRGDQYVDDRTVRRGGRPDHAHEGAA